MMEIFLGQALLGEDQQTVDKEHYFAIWVYLLDHQATKKRYPCIRVDPKAWEMAQRQDHYILLFFFTIKEKLNGPKHQ